MGLNLVNLFKAEQSTPLAPVTANKALGCNNPFENPFISSSGVQNSAYAKNQPIQGGYFAGYYNGKPNIVGQRLFIEA